MMKSRIILFFAGFVTTVSLAAAQNTVASPSEKRGPNSPHTTTKPLTPKSAMPPKTNRKPVTAAPTAKSGQNANAELSHLERQDIKTSGSRVGSPAASKAASIPSASKSEKAPDINFSYQKPAANKKIVTGSNSTTPKIQKR